MKKALSTLLSSSLLAAGVAVATSALTAATAQAFSLYIDPQYGSSNSPATGSTAKLDFDFVQSGGDVLLNLGIKNTTGSVTSSVTTSGATQSTLVGIGFDLASIISSYTYDSKSSPFTKLYGDDDLTNQQLEGDASLSPFGTYDVGIRSAGSGNFIGGNPQEGLTAGQSTSVSFTLKGSNLTVAGVEDAFKKGFSNGTLEAVGRFQQVGGVNYSGSTSDKVKGGGVVYSGGNNGGTPKIPEPSTLAGLGLAAASLTVSRRRKVCKTA